MKFQSLLLNYKTKQVGSKKNIFQYNHALSLSVVEVENKIIPVIDMDVSSLSLKTLTEVSGESCDDFRYCISTETRASQEDSDCCIDLMLATKTFSNVESDD